MADIAFDAITDGAGSSTSYSHTTSGSDRLLFVTGQSSGTGPTTPSGVTYNGVAMTLLETQVNTLSGSTAWIYYLINPASGAHTVAITGSILDSCAISYTGCQQSGVPDAIAKQGNTSAATLRTGTVTTIADRAWTLLATINDFGDGSASTGSFKRKSSGGGGFNLFDSNGLKTPAGAASMTATCGGAADWCDIILSFAPLVVIDQLAWRGSYPDLLLDTSVESVASGFIPRPPVNPTDPTPT